ncbi:hypothetical protein ACLQ24_04050 [Micromonospora sp. DT4]
MLLTQVRALLPASATAAGAGRSPSVLAPATVAALPIAPDTAGGTMPTTTPVATAANAQLIDCLRTDSTPGLLPVAPRLARPSTQPAQPGAATAEQTVESPRMIVEVPAAAPVPEAGWRTATIKA